MRRFVLLLIMIGMMTSIPTVGMAHDAWVQTNTPILEQEKYHMSSFYSEITLTNMEVIA